MIPGLKYAPFKSAVNKVKLPRVLFYKATGCKGRNGTINCAKGAEGLYNAVDTKTGKF